jgi:hypothetical protein
MKNRRCWLRISSRHYAGSMKHCHRFACVDYHGILVCTFHADDIAKNGIRPVFAYTNTVMSNF